MRYRIDCRSAEEPWEPVAYHFFLFVAILRAGLCATSLNHAPLWRIVREEGQATVLFITSPRAPLASEGDFCEV